MEMQKNIFSNKNNLKFKKANLALNVFAKLLHKDSNKIKAFEALAYLQDKKVNLFDLAQTLFNPRPLHVNNREHFSIAQIKSELLPSILIELRGQDSLKDLCAKLNLPNVSTYHHYEKQIRDVPFEIFIYALEASQKLEVFLSLIDFKKISIDHHETQDFDIENLNKYHVFSKDFFSKPWVPSVYLLIQLPQFSKIKNRNKQYEYISNVLNLNKQQIQDSFEVLSRLNIVHFKEEKIEFSKGQFFNPPQIDKKALDEIHTYWFSRAKEHLNMNGYHRLEQHTVTEETQVRIINWIKELREKIKQEVLIQKGEADRLIHINWSLTELTYEKQ